MRWPWRRVRPQPRHLAPGERWPDGDQVLHPGDRRSADIIRAVLDEPTQPILLPIDRLFMTRAAEWRSRGRRRTWS